MKNANDLLKVLALEEEFRKKYFEFTRVIIKVSDNVKIKKLVDDLKKSGYNKISVGKIENNGYSCALFVDILFDDDYNPADLIELATDEETKDFIKKVLNV